MKRIKRVIGSPAILVAVLALIAAVGGTALAGSGPTANTAGKAEKALKKAKKAIKIAKAADKEVGPKGDKGDPGAKGDPGVSAYERVENDLLTALGTNGTVFTSVECPGTKQPLGGGVEVTSATEPAMAVQHLKDVKLLESYPNPPPARKWAATIKNEFGSALDIDWSIWAVCADVL